MPTWAPSGNFMNMNINGLDPQIVSHIFHAAACLRIVLLALARCAREYILAQHVLLDYGVFQ
jgi:hypothetical protein